MKTLERALGLGAALLSLSACGGGPAAPSTSGGTQTATFMGTSETSTTGGCSSPQNHDFQAGEGMVTVTLVQASASAAKVEVCQVTTGSQARECGIPAFATVQVGQSTSGTLRGGRAQRVTVYPTACGATSPAPSTLTYTVTVVYPR
ncbi:MAG TPA: hypothetical protein VIZ31_04180 [Vicinamibacteria bacterium]